MISALAVLAALLLVACLADYKSRRIPNILVLLGLALGLLFQAFAPAGKGLFVWDSSGSLGASSAILGALIGLAAFLPFYMLRTMGAGDVKLLAMVGAWVGPTAAAMVALWTMLAGGVLALVWMLATRSSARVATNLKTIMSGSSTLGGDSPGSSLRGSTTAKLPYAWAIAAGTVIEIVRHWL